MNRRGFTLIEALAAIALTAIMMTAVMSVLPSMTRGEEATHAAAHEADWRVRVIRAIELDLQHAEKVQSLDGGVVLTGHVALDRNTFMPTHQSAVVRYSISQGADKFWLIRTQTDPEDRALKNSWIQLMCSGVNSISISSGEANAMDGVPEAIEKEEIQEEEAETHGRITLPIQAMTLNLKWHGDPLVTTADSILLR